MSPLPILYQDDILVAVSKPAGMLVHRTKLDPHERDNAMHVVRDQLGRWVYPFHRLDKGTSGVLLFALDKETAGYMTSSFTEGMVSKTYLAVVRGFTDLAGRIDHPLQEMPDRVGGQGWEQNRTAKAAVTEFRRTATVELTHPVGRYATARYSLIEVSPRTGRSHQIRRHMKHIFHPVIGDTTHGDGKHNEFFRKQFGCSRLLLHARTISFVHPRDGRRLAIEAPLDSTFCALLENLPWQYAGMSNQKESALPQGLPLPRPQEGPEV